MCHTQLSTAKLCEYMFINSCDLIIVNMIGRCTCFAELVCYVMDGNDWQDMALKGKRGRDFSHVPSRNIDRIRAMEQSDAGHLDRLLITASSCDSTDAQQRYLALSMQVLSIQDDILSQFHRYRIYVYYSNHSLR